MARAGLLIIYYAHDSLTEHVLLNHPLETAIRGKTEGDKHLLLMVTDKQRAVRRVRANAGVSHSLAVSGRRNRSYRKHCPRCRKARRNLPENALPQ